MGTANITLEEVESALRRVPPQKLPDVLTFIEFLEYQAEHSDAELDDASEDAGLWAAVEANHAYRAKHPGEMIVHESAEDLLADTSDL
ncbi:MAG TPA: hypothetical protein VFF59_02300 [Anaerolineae bacterium]|nr:hypothetical protein [Anaerolineae bacterium]